MLKCLHVQATLSERCEKTSRERLHAERVCVSDSVGVGERERVGLVVLDGDSVRDCVALIVEVAERVAVLKLVAVLDRVRGEEGLIQTLKICHRFRTKMV